VAIEGDDMPTHGDRVWLKGYGPVRHTRDAFEYTGEDIDVVREEGVPVIHWAPADGPRMVLRTKDGDVEGVAEPGVLAYDEGALVQFERVGFARVDDLTRDPAVAYYAHA
jgi:glutamyl-tRNA synthetase